MNSFDIQLSQAIHNERINTAAQYTETYTASRPNWLSRLVTYLTTRTAKKAETRRPVGRVARQS